MGASKEYFMRLREEEFNNLPNDEQSYLMHLGMGIRQLPTDIDENDEVYKKLRKTRIESWNKEQEHLYNKRIKNEQNSRN